MKVGKFFKRLFPCLSKQEEQPKPVYSKEQEVIIGNIVDNLVDDRRQYFEDELSKERQKRLEELRLEELKQQQAQELERQRIESEERAKEEFERILREAEERQRQEEEEQRRLEELRKYEEAQLLEEQRLLEEERKKEEHIKTVVQNMFVKYKEQYHEFFSTRPQPIHSNFNEKMFKELCSKFTFNNEEELEACLKDYNLMQKQNKAAYNQLSRKRRLKCDVFNFYLFIDCNH